MILPFQNHIQTRPNRFASYYNQFGKPSQKKPQPDRPDWLVVFTFVMIALTLLFS
ncbi:hypothetical protein [Larkinella terrae]|uniref:Uncharacterized protein n=1 Tax=Larkinella terrae TaxID=2025311 RepID=A0A7K0ETC2_9BACT|nr:hypothetical protein [Larkinella terrae]MRS65019.1 hypothetical protein [Larkinella terrae]